MIKTNVMRLLEQAKIPYQSYEYEVEEDNLSGEHIAKQLGLSCDKVFKTLVAVSDRKGIYVFCIPVNSELDLKKAAKAAGEKKIEMLHMKDLLAYTGYIRGGCSPIGMKKKYPTFIDETAILFDTITVSAGIRGCQIELDPNELINYVDAKEIDLTRE